MAIGAYAFLVVGDTKDLRHSVEQVVEKSFRDYNDTEVVREEFDMLQVFVSKNCKPAKHIRNKYLGLLINYKSKLFQGA